MKRLALFSLLSLLSGLVMSACSEGSVVRPSDARVDSSPQSCGPGTCKGCCLGTICTEGSALSACGVGGEACLECGTGMICQTGKCVPSSTGCSASNCKGCCDGDSCRSGVGNDACGQGGSPCVDCAAKSGVCSAATHSCLASCTPNCTGKCKGADDTCGGKCQVNDCRGCCAGEQCLPGILGAACGKDGVQCSDCTKQAGSQCGTDRKCTSCTPDCKGKCAGASDECGGTCTTSDCAGCCVGYVCEVGSADGACGTGGGACADCASKGVKCKAGTCGASCTPDCAGKCPGASDGCGKTCQTNGCTGCCDGTSCLAGASDTACGKAGQSCSVCPTDYQGYQWKCSGQACVKDKPTGGSDCTGKTGGTVACTDNGVAGKCWDGKCCTGCYDTSIPTCWNYVNTYDDSCGDGGLACVDCTKTSKVCKNYKCETPTATGPCAGKKEFDACTDGSYTGKCIGGACCTGCYYVDGGTMKCQAIPNDAHCGKMGGSCTACKPYQACQGISGTCVLDMAAKFALEASKAMIKNDPSKTWDIVGSAPPDPYLGFVLSSTSCSSTVVDKCTGKDDNTYDPVWNFKLGTYTAAELVGEHCVSIFDADGPSACAIPFETIGRCKISFAEQDLDWGFSWTFSCPNPNDSKNYVTGIRFGFTFVP